MPSSRKRRPQSFDLTPPGGAEPAPSGWTYRSGAGDAPSPSPQAAPATPTASAAPAASRTGSVIDWIVWPAEFLFVLLFAPRGARRKQ